MLPKLNAPTFSIKLISLDKPIRFRPFTVGEEKILLVAEESKEEADILFAIRQVLQNSVVDEIDVSKLPLFDLEYFFIQARAKSVSNVSEVKYRDKEDNEVRSFKIDFDSLVPYVDPVHSTEINLGENTILKLKYPTIETMTKLSSMNLNEVDTTIQLIMLCMDKIITEDDVYVCSDVPQEERISFIESLSSKQFEMIVDQFINSMPKIRHTIEYKNNLGNDRQIVLESIEDFFS